MKFTDGYWEMRPGIKPHYAAQVHEALIEENALTIFAPVGRLQERGHRLVVCLEFGYDALYLGLTQICGLGEVRERHCLSRDKEQCLDQCLPAYFLPLRWW